jgi:hypothetical protein
LLSLGLPLRGLALCTSLRAGLTLRFLCGGHPSAFPRLIAPTAGCRRPYSQTPTSPNTGSIFVGPRREEGRPGDTRARSPRPFPQRTWYGRSPTAPWTPTSHGTANQPGPAKPPDLAAGFLVNANRLIPMPCGNCCHLASTFARTPQVDSRPTPLRRHCGEISPQGPCGIPKTVSLYARPAITRG